MVGGHRAPRVVSRLLAHDRAPEGAKAGDRVECCGRRYVLTFAYGAFALEAPAEDQ